MENSKHDPASYVADSSQLEALRAGVESQQAIGREAFEREQQALDQMQRHFETVRRYMLDPHSVDHSDPAVREILGKRAAALSSALRGIK